MRFVLAILLLASVACESGGSSSKRADATTADVATASAHVLQCASGECTDPATGLVWTMAMQGQTDPAAVCAAHEAPLSDDWRAPTCDEVVAIDASTTDSWVNESLDFVMGLCVDAAGTVKVRGPVGFSPVGSNDYDVFCVRGP